MRVSRTRRGKTINLNRPQDFLSQQKHSEKTHTSSEKNDTDLKDESSSSSVCLAFTGELDTPDFKRQRHDNFTPDKGNEKSQPLIFRKKLNLAPPTGEIQLSLPRSTLACVVLAIATCYLWHLWHQHIALVRVFGRIHCARRLCWVFTHQTRNPVWRGNYHFCLVHIEQTPRFG